jgi:hypothetical protein
MKVKNCWLREPQPPVFNSLTGGANIEPIEMLSKSIYHFD